jgi:predicted RNase H-like HicB family nuclease
MGGARGCVGERGKWLKTEKKTIRRSGHDTIVGVMKFVVSIYQDEDGVYVAECPSIPGCVSQGLTEAEAEANVVDAIRECLAVRAELAMPLTVTTREVEVAV